MSKMKSLLTETQELIALHNDLLDLYDAVEYYFYPHLFADDVSEWDEKVAISRIEYTMKRIKEKKENE